MEDVMRQVRFYFVFFQIFVSNFIFKNSGTQVTQSVLMKQIVILIFSIFIKTIAIHLLIILPGLTKFTIFK